MSKDRTRFMHLVGYGSGSMVMASYYLISGSFLLFATAILGVPPHIAGAIMAASTLWDALIDVPLGWWSDRTRSQRFGRRHPFLIVGGLGLTVLTAALWATPQNLGSTATLVWLTLATIALKTAIAAFVVPHTALGAEIVDSYDGRMVAQGYRATFQVIGMIAALVGSNLIFFRPTEAYPQGQLNPEAYAPLGMACAVLVLIATIGTVIGTWRFVPQLRAPSSPHESIREMLSGLLRDRNLRALTLTILSIELTLQIGISLGTHINTYTFGLTGPQIAILALAMLGSAALAQPLWIYIGKRYDKRQALFAATIVALIGFVIAPLSHVAWGWFPMDSSADIVWTLLPFQILAGAGTGAYWSLPFAMVGDCALARERVTGKSVSGSYTGMYIFAYKLGSGISIAASGLLLQIIGYDASLATQSADTRYWLAVAPAVLILAGFPLVLWALRGYRLMRTDFAQPAAATAMA